MKRMNIKTFSITKKVNMKKLYCVICGKYKKFRNPKISYVFVKHQYFLLFAGSARIKMKKYLKKQDQLRFKKFLVSLKIYNYFKNMVEENISQEFRLKIWMKQEISFLKK